MKIENFFPALRDYFKTIPAVGNAVYLVPAFPIEQLSRFPNPSIFIVNSGHVPFPFHPNIVYNDFTIGLWVSDMRDAYGEHTIGKLYDLEHAIQSLAINLQTLSSEKVIITYLRTGTIGVTKDNNPLMLRYWTYQTILEV